MWQKSMRGAEGAWRVVPRTQATGPCGAEGGAAAVTLNVSGHGDPPWGDAETENLHSRRRTLCRKRKCMGLIGRFIFQSLAL